MIQLYCDKYYFYINKNRFINKIKILDDYIYILKQNKKFKDIISEDDYDIENFIEIMEIILPKKYYYYGKYYVILIKKLIVLIDLLNMNEENRIVLNNYLSKKLYRIIETEHNYLKRFDLLNINIILRKMVFLN